MKRSDAILGGAAAVFGAAIYLMTLSFPAMADGAPGPALFPRILAALLVLFGSVIVVQSRQKRVDEEIVYEMSAILKGALVLVCIAVYVAVVQKLGFVITSLGLLLALMLMLGVRVLTAALSSVLIVTFCVLLFQKLLRVPLPPGLLGF